MKTLRAMCVQHPLFQPRFRRAAASLVLLIGAGCNPGAFSRDEPGSEAEPAELPDGGASDGGKGGRPAPAARAGAGGRGGAGGSRSPAAGDGGTSGPEAEGGKGGNEPPNDDPSDPPPDAGSGGAGAGGSTASGGAGAESPPPEPRCPGLNLDTPRATRVRDDVLQVPAPYADVVNAAAVLHGDALVWTFGTPFESPSQGRPIVSRVGIDGIRGGTPRLEQIAELMPEEPSGFGASTVSNGAWLGSDGTFQLFFARFAGWDTLGVGLARAPLDPPGPATVIKTSDQLFVAPPPTTLADGGMRERFYPKFLTGVVPSANLLYAYVCQANPALPDESANDGAHFQPCRLARVSAGQESDGSSYAYWSQGSWDTQLSAASVVVDHVPGSLTVTWSEYLQRYIAVHSGAANNVVLRWADALHGPFHELGNIPTAVASGGAIALSYSGQGLPVPQAEDCDNRFYVAYTVPLRRDELDASASTPRLETHVLQLRFE